MANTGKPTTDPVVRKAAQSVIDQLVSATPDIDRILAGLAVVEAAIDTDDNNKTVGSQGMFMVKGSGAGERTIVDALGDAKKRQKALTDKEQGTPLSRAETEEKTAITAALDAVTEHMQGHIKERARKQSIASAAERLRAKEKQKDRSFETR